MLITGKLFKTSKQPLAVLPLPVIANIIGHSSVGISFLLSYYPILLKWIYASSKLKYL